MEIKQYAPRYKKAMMDMAIKDLKESDKIRMVAINILCEDKICLVALDQNKFKGFIIGKPIDNETVFCNYWVSKDNVSGIALARAAMQEAKNMGFKYAEFYRRTDKTYHRKELK